MRKAIGLLAVLLLLISSTWCFGATQSVELLSDQMFIRGTGTPVTETVTFPGLAGKATIKLTNGDATDTTVERVSSSVIKVNGTTVFDASNFNQNVSTLQKEITLAAGQNSLSVLLKSKPGGRIHITIVQQVEADAAGVVGPLGGMLTVTDSASPIYGATIHVPANALTNPIVLTMSPGTMPKELPNEALNAGPSVNFGPDGTKFLVPLTITLPYFDNDNDGFIDGTDIPEEYVSSMKFNDELQQWLYLKRVGQDTANNTITYESQSFSNDKIVVTDPQIFGKSGAIIYTIDGCDLSTILEPGAPGEYRPEYLRPAVIYMLSEQNLTDGIVIPYRWHGDPNYTPHIVSMLVPQLESAYNLALNNSRKFILITHSWGTVLGILGLNFSDVNPDLFITLSSPAGAGIDIWDQPKGALVQSYYAMQSLATIAYMATYYYKIPHEPNYKTWINYWAYGDFVSGPIVAYPDIFNIRIDGDTNNSNLRDDNSTNIYHAITSLDAEDVDYYYSTRVGSWKTYLWYPTHLQYGKSFRSIVAKDLCDVIGTCHLSSDRPATHWGWTPMLLNVGGYPGMFGLDDYGRPINYDSSPISISWNDGRSMTFTSPFRIGMAPSTSFQYTSLNPCSSGLPSTVNVTEVGHDLYQEWGYLSASSPVGGCWMDGNNWYLVGDLTPLSNLNAQSGQGKKGKYTGTIRGQYYINGSVHATVNDVGGMFTCDVDFATKTVSNFSVWGSGGGHTFTYSSGSTSWTSANNQFAIFNSGVRKIDEIAVATVTGYGGFFGPNAEKIGGVLALTNTAGNPHVTVILEGNFEPAYTPCTSVIGSWNFSRTAASQGTLNWTSDVRADGRLYDTTTDWGCYYINGNNVRIEYWCDPSYRTTYFGTIDDTCTHITNGVAFSPTPGSGWIPSSEYNWSANKQ